MDAEDRQLMNDEVRYVSRGVARYMEQYVDEPDGAEMFASLRRAEPPVLPTLLSDTGEAAQTCVR